MKHRMNVDSEDVRSITKSPGQLNE